MKNIISEIDNNINFALVERNVHNSGSQLRNAINSAEKNLRRFDSNDKYHLISIAVRAYMALIEMAPTIQERRKWRQRCMSWIQKGLTNDPHVYTLIEDWCRLLADWTYDQIDPPNYEVIRHLLAAAWRMCKAAIGIGRSEMRNSSLLAHWSAIKRCQAHLFGKSAGRKYMENALAVSLSNYKKHPAHLQVQVDFALTLWQSARYSGSEKEFNRKIIEVEDLLYAAHKANSLTATIALSRFYRQTYRSVKSIRMFKEYLRRERRVRLIYPQCHILAEAATQLIHAQIPDRLKRDIIEWIFDFLISSVNAGYRNARVFVAIARLSHYLGDLHNAKFYIQALSCKQNISWMELIETAEKFLSARDLKILDVDYVLGTKNGSVWNALGTYALECEEDRGLALKMYTISSQLNPYSPVVHTNIARLLLEEEDPSTWPKIAHHLHQAGCCSDYTFQWWRPLKNRFENLSLSTVNPLRGYRSKSNDVTMNSLYADFIKLETMNDSSSQRGMLFEILFKQLVDIIFSPFNTAMNLKLAGRQSDISFIFSQHCYRCELSWDSDPNGVPEVDKLFLRARALAGARGLLVSMSGFTQTITSQISQHIKECLIITLDREELRSILKREINFGTLLEEKITSLMLHI